MLRTRSTDLRPTIELISTFDLACRRAGLTHDQVAGLLGMKKEQLYQQLRLQGHFSLTRLVRLRDDPDGRKFLREYWPLVAADMGISEVANKLAVADAFQVFIDTLQVRMAKADLHAAEMPEKKRA
jgi:hypothetical protein